MRQEPESCSCFRVIATLKCKTCITVVYTMCVFGAVHMCRDVHAGVRRQPCELILGTEQHRLSCQCIREASSTVSKPLSAG